MVARQGFQEAGEPGLRFGHGFEPGTDWDYSNTNYFLLGVVIERASGLGLPEAYRRYVFDPLGMSTSWLVLHEPARAVARRHLPAR